MATRTVGDDTRNRLAITWVRVVAVLVLVVAAVLSVVGAALDARLGSVLGALSLIVLTAFPHEQFVDTYTEVE